MLLLAAFLFLPAFVFFLDLIALSAPVFETMRLFLSKYVTKLLKSLRSQYLYLSLRNVKTSSIIFSLLISTVCKSDNLEHKDILLSIGEHTEIQLEGVAHYTIGNRDILAAQKLEGQSTLLIKAKSQGYSEIYLKKTNRNQEKYKFTIITKSRRKKLNNLADLIKSLGLRATTRGEIILVSGLVTRLEDLNTITKLAVENPEITLQQLIIYKKNQNRHIAKLYQIFWRDNIKDVSCKNIGLKYRCFYHSKKLSPQIKKLLRRYKFLEIVELQNVAKEKLCLEQSLFQISNDILSQQELMNPEIILSPIRKNNMASTKLDFIFSGKKIGSKLLSRNTVQITVDKKITLSNGIKSPVFTKSENNLTFTSDWIFIGLKSEIEVTKIGNRYQLSMTTKISSPSSNESLNYDQTTTNLILTKNNPSIYFTKKINQFNENKVPILPIPYLKDISFLSASTNSQNSTLLLGQVLISDKCSL